jgi:hypothetical protein
MRPLAVVLVNSSFQPAVTVDDSAADDRAVPDSALRATVPSHAPRRAYADA